MGTTVKMIKNIGIISYPLIEIGTDDKEILASMVIADKFLPRIYTEFHRY